MKSKSLLLVFFTSLLFSCTQFDTSRSNYISYSVASALILPTDTSSKFNIEFLNENGEIIKVENTNRFNYSFKVEGDGKSYLKAVSLDSIELSGTISQNGNVIGRRVGIDWELSLDFN